MEVSGRHLHHNMTTALLVIGYVITLGAIVKFMANKFPVAGLTDLVNYVF